LICSLIEPEPMPEEAKAAFRHDAFMAIFDEEADRLTSDPRLVADIRREIMGGDEARGGDLPPD